MRRRAGVVRGSDDAGHRRAAFHDGVLVLCVVALVGVVVLGGVLMLLYWVAATLPLSLLMACPEFDSCVVPVADENQAVWVDDPRTDGPKMTR